MSGTRIDEPTMIAFFKMGSEEMETNRLQAAMLSLMVDCWDRDCTLDFMIDTFRSFCSLAAEIGMYEAMKAVEGHHHMRGDVPLADIQTTLAASHERVKLNAQHMIDMVKLLQACPPAEEPIH